MPYATRLIREARAEAVAEQADAEFQERLLDALGNRSVKSAIRALIPAASKSTVTRTSQRT